VGTAKIEPHSIWGDRFRLLDALLAESFAA
jgi:hypothetical protein